MKKIIYTLAAILLLSGCNDFLDTDNLTKKDTGNFPVNVTDAEQMLTGIYATLNKAISNPSHTHFYMAELASDDRFGGGGENDKDMQGLDHFMNTKSSRFGTFWAARYKGIFRANTAIETLDNIKGWESEDQKNQLYGEVYFLRALFYFEMAQMFGEVPLVLKTEVQNLPKAPADQIYAQIASDLKQAITLMPSKPYTSVTSGHATKWSAEALMARVYLFYTGYYQKGELPLAEGGSVDKAQAAAWLDDCIANSGHSLASDFRNLWPYSNEYTAKDYPYAKKNGLKWEGDGNKETVFAVKFSNKASWDTDNSGVDNTGYSNQYIQHFGLRSNNGEEDTYPFGPGWGAGPVNSNLWKEWQIAEPNDIRRVASILNVNNNSEVKSFIWGADKQMEETGYWQKKYTTIRAHKEDGSLVGSYTMLMFGYPEENASISHSQDLVLIRFADVLLMHSELKGDATSLNKVRTRVGLPSVSYSLDAIKRERRWELSFEGLRYFDLMRWGDAAAMLAKQEGVTVYNKGLETTMRAFGGGYRARYEATGGFWAIPEDQIALSNGVLTQNKGWGGADAEFPGW
ncbi:RagB/SusD family nutrient uptake outer membrane protein [Dysgonomonas sp. ZJ709]|uniref:RagB/SusD family nutrient uptake outer membrane protein n=1 Tax=Dysgonomonas sp. ZJ709 TaxID=2709797 RepID=UPI0013EBCB96|nr:RagB/SusD family nutrient uptake outer membrane protein [Dysgonomonas sp. ZJ709]